MTRPTQTDPETMRDLWDAFARHALHYMTEVPPEKRTIRHLAVIRAFLADMGISAQVGREAADTGKHTRMLTLTIPFGGPDGSGH
jgi:hypothetical protein